MSYGLLLPYILKITTVANSIISKRNIHQRLKVVKIQQQQKWSPVSLGNSKLGKPKHIEIWSPGWSHYWRNYFWNQLNSASKRNISISENLDVFLLWQKDLSVGWNKNLLVTLLFLSNSIFGVNVRVAKQIYISKIESCLEVA